MKPDLETAAALILCGGQSTRMGTDKALLTLDGEPFLSRICRIVATRFQTILAVAAHDQSLPELPPVVRIVRDQIPNGGPLTGLHSGLQDLQIQAPGITRFWLGSCDAPFVCLEVIEALLETPGDWDAVAVESEGQLQPLGAVYRIAVADTVCRLVESGERRLGQLLREIVPLSVDADRLREHDDELQFLQNINTPQDYRQFITRQ